MPTNVIMADLASAVSPMPLMISFAAGPCMVAPAPTRASRAAQAPIHAWRRPIGLHPDGWSYRQ
ncbi:MAG: hypothetical protein ACRCVA_18390, partial [Phreatobacter sp.]